MKHLYLPLNTKGHDYGVGDIHGEFRALQDVLDFIGFRPEKDRLICTGDLVDKGRFSRLAYDYLNKPWFFSVMGNHDWHVANWDGNLDSNWIKNWGSWFARLNDVFKDQMHCTFATKLPIAITLETRFGHIGVIHSGTPHRTWIETIGVISNAVKRDQYKPFLFERKYYEERTNDAPSFITDLYALLVGHCPTESGEIERVNNTFFMDTDGYKDGKFNIKCLTHKQLY